MSQRAILCQDSQGSMQTRGQTKEPSSQEDSSKQQDWLYKMAKHRSRGVSNSKEERVEVIGWTHK